MRTILFFTAIGLLTTSVGAAADLHAAPASWAQSKCSGQPDRCGDCGCDSSCEKTCRVVCEMKKVKTYVWVVECEEFCPLLPGCGSTCQSGCGCEPDCCGVEECGGRCGKDPCESLQARRYVPPKCAKTRCRKKLVKKEITCEVPVYKCIPAYACSGCSDGCAAGAEAAPAPPGQATYPAPLPPAVSSTGYLTQSRKQGTPQMD